MYLQCSCRFLSTLSLRRATVEEVSGDTWARGFYPRSPCGERPGSARGISSGNAVSIHALLAESDLASRLVDMSAAWFLSTLSLRRATKGRAVYLEILSGFYPRSPCGERLLQSGQMSQAQLFLSTLSLRRATFNTTRVGVSGKLFLSTLSLRRATKPPASSCQ